jgi:hypothetical protein
MAHTVPLSKPLKTHDGEVSELKLRDLTASDMVEARNSPIKMARVGDEVTHEYRYDVIMKLASRLSGVDDLILGSLNPRDFHELTAKVVDLWNAAGE